MKMLTNENLKALAAPFPLGDHELRWDGNVYLTELPLLERLTDIDPNWEFRITSTVVTDYNLSRPDCVTVNAELTICGITRAGTGSAVADVTTKDKQGKQLTTPIIRALNNKELKGASTDAMKRCARQFGVGAYILRTKGTSIRNFGDFERWYRREFGEQSQNAPSPQPRRDTPATPPKARQTVDDGKGGSAADPRDDGHIDDFPTINSVWPSVAESLLEMNVSDLPVSVGGIIYPMATARLGYEDDNAVKAAIQLDSLNEWQGTLEALMKRVIEVSPVAKE
jgi:hypothetical protein